MLKLYDKAKPRSIVNGVFSQRCRKIRSAVISCLIQTHASAIILVQLIVCAQVLEGPQIRNNEIVVSSRFVMKTFERYRLQMVFVEYENMAVIFIRRGFCLVLGWDVQT